jgi:hypothetical protein
MNWPPSSLKPSRNAFGSKQLNVKAVTKTRDVFEIKGQFLRGVLFVDRGKGSR